MDIRNKIFLVDAQSLILKISGGGTQPWEACLLPNTEGDMCGLVTTPERKREPRDWRQFSSFKSSLGRDFFESILLKQKLTLYDLIKSVKTQTRPPK